MKSFVVFAIILFSAAAMAAEAPKNSNAEAEKDLKGSETAYLTYPYVAYPYAAFPYAYPYVGYPYPPPVVPILRR